MSSLNCACANCDKRVCKDDYIFCDNCGEAFCEKCIEASEAEPDSFICDFCREDI
jgi:hypothetical protein